MSITKIGSESLREIEPHVQGIAAIRVPIAGIVDYCQVSETYASFIRKRGGKIELGDRIAKKSGLNPEMKIVPFLGEYYQLMEHKRHLVKHLIYPVPNPNFPFLGVHFTRRIDGTIEAGPNAVLSLKREGYIKKDISMKDMGEIFRYSGFWKLASNYWQEGIGEMVRSFSKKAFVRSLQQLIPEISEEDMEPAPSGVRAQALKANGDLVDDFHIISGKNSIHVCNAPSPAATASLPIGKAVVQKIKEHGV